LISASFGIYISDNAHLLIVSVVRMDGRQAPLAVAPDWEPVPTRREPRLNPASEERIPGGDRLKSVQEWYSVPNKHVAELKFDNQLPIDHVRTAEADIDSTNCY
jgi:hypothetical protein